MPRVAIAYDPEVGEYSVHPVAKNYVPDAEYEVVVELKASHYQNIKRNLARVQKDQVFLNLFFIRAQELGNVIREQ